MFDKIICLLHRGFYIGYSLPNRNLIPCSDMIVFIMGGGVTCVL